MLSGELWGMGHEAEAVPKGVPCFSGWGKFYAIGLPIESAEKIMVLKGSSRS